MEGVLQKGAFLCQCGLVSVEEAGKGLNLTQAPKAAFGLRPLSKKFSHWIGCHVV